MIAHYLHPAEQLVAFLQRLYDYGMTTTSGGNLSIKDADGNIWITPGGIDKGSLRPEDIIMVQPDGKTLGPHKPSSELPFHRSVYQLRKDVRAVLHAHAPALVAFSMVGRIPNTALVPGLSNICKKTAFAGYEIPGSQKLGDVIAAEFAAGADSVIMENHGAVVCGNSIADAFARFEALDYAASLEIHAAGLTGLNAPQELPSANECAPFRNEEALPSPSECAARETIVKFSIRCSRQKLMCTGTAGMALRIGDREDDFIAVPAGFDPLTLHEEELVRISGGRAEAGKIPFEGALQCREIFRKHAGIHAVILARPPELMIHAASGRKLDSRTIPESYILLRDVPQLSLAEYMRDPALAAKRIAPNTPVLMIAHYGLLTTGKDLLSAFDRMEVGAFTAKCLLLAERIGKFKPITQEQVRDLVKAFNLPE